MFENQYLREYFAVWIDWRVIGKVFLKRYHTNYCFDAQLRRKQVIAARIFISQQKNARAIYFHTLQRQSISKQMPWKIISPGILFRFKRFKAYWNCYSKTLSEKLLLSRGINNEKNRAARIMLPPKKTAANFLSHFRYAL